MKNVEDAYQLSPMQQGMLFHSLGSRDAVTYVEQVGWTFEGRLDPAAFEKAWRRVVERHPILRTVFFWEGLEEPLQVVRRRVELTWEREDWQHLPAAEQEERFRAFLEADRRRGFHLSRAPLIRLAQIRLAQERFRFVWTYHHALLDGWSAPLVLREVFLFYQAFSQGQELELDKSRPYRDFIAWIRDQNLESAEAFWRRTLAGFNAPTPLAGNDSSAASIGQRVDGEGGYSTHRTVLARSQNAELQAFARRHQLTLNTVLQGVWGVLLSRYSGVEDVVFGGVVSGRPPVLEGVDTMMGLFVNTLPVRVRANADATVVPWLQELHSQQLEIRRYEHSPLLRIHDWSEIARGQPLFESLIVFENLPADSTFDQGEDGPRIHSAFRVDPRTGYPLSVEVFPGDELALHLTWDRRRFDASTIARIGRHFVHLLSALPEDSERRLADLPMLDPAERQQVQAEWSDTTSGYPRQGTLPALFAEQARRTPAAVAVVSGEQHVSYGELARRASRLASRLSVSAGQPVGLMAERSPTLMITMLAILEAGGAYVPLDPSYPEERLAWLIADAQLSIVFADAPFAAGLRARGVEVLTLDHGVAPLPEAAPAETSVTAQDLAYVMYTSGSTGRPKGVAVTHRNVVRLVRGADFAALDGDRAFLQLAPISFDASTLEIWGPLLGGGRLVLFPPRSPSLDELGGELKRHRIDILWLTSGLFDQMVESHLQDLRPVRQLLAGGDVLSPENVRRVLEELPETVLINGYGPTENTTFTCCHRMARPEHGPAPGCSVPIGRPIADTRIRLLDRALEAVPVAVAGFLYAGGDGVSRGYFRRPGLTAERFVPDPSPAVAGDRLYATGDLARWRPDGRIEFLGRVDGQVKLRGFRVELGEVESALSSHPGVRAAAAVIVGVGDAKRLVGYVVPNTPGQVTTATLLDHLHQQMPPYMVPQTLEELEALPLDPNGKLDRTELARRARPQTAEAGLAVRYDAPRTALEDLLAGMVAEQLQLSRVGIHDDFFDLGGHSLLATRLLSRVQKTFEVELPLAALFAGPTVAQMAEQVDSATRGLKLPPIESVAGQDSIPLTFAQQRLWLIDQMDPGNPVYNVPIALEARGELDIAMLEAAYREVVRRHDTLRTRFEWMFGEPVQIVDSDLAPGLAVVDLSALPAAARAVERQRQAQAEGRFRFDLFTGSLRRLTVLKQGAEEHVVLLNLHHIVSDGWSLDVLLRELKALYAALATGQPTPLEELNVQYADYALWQRRVFTDDQLASELAYWRQQLRDLPVLELPSDRPRPSHPSWRGATFHADLPETVSRTLRQLARSNGATLFMALEAITAAFLARTAGQDDVAMGSAHAHRERVELEKLIGFFINTQVLRNDLSEDPSLRQLLARVRKVALEAWTHQAMPFEKLVEELQPDRQLGTTPLFQVMFALQNTPIGRLELPGVVLEPLATTNETAKFDLYLAFTETDGGLHAALEYNRDLFDGSTIHRWWRRLASLLEGWASTPQRRLSEAPWLSGAERHQLQVEWAGTASSYPRRATLPELFVAQAAQTPDAVALVSSEEHVTYSELERRSTRLAASLGIEPGALVGLMAGRSPATVTAMLAILKAGGAYIPLDPSYPEERLAWLITDSCPALVLSEERFVPLLAAHGVETRRLDRDARGRSMPASAHPAPAPESLAYVMYTSGSTGRPKGVAVTHRNIVRLVREADFADLGPGRVFMQLAPVSFDASTLEIWGPLLGGGRLVVPSQQQLSLEELGAEIRRRRVDSLWLTAGLFHQMVANNLEGLRPLRQLLAGGDVLSPERVRRVLTELPDTILINGYGPTENTTFTCCHRLAGPLAAPTPGRSVPIGRPIADTRVQVLDRYMMPAPVGVVGYLYTDGDGVSRGYAGRPGLTAERFVPSPLRALSAAGEPSDDGSGQRMYATGDLARWLPDGRVEFLGRRDGQIKIRGFRVELGEVESVLTGLTGVRAAAARIFGQDENKRLAGYFVAARPGELMPETLSAELRARLPAYMVPQALVELTALPLDANGKVDRGALPEPEATVQEAVEAPRSSTEELLAGIVAQLLDLPEVGVHADFFDLGGHSLLATQVVSRVRQVFGVELTLRELFEAPAVAQLAARIDKAQRGDTSAIMPAERVSRDQPLPLSFAQQRLWFIDQMEPGNPVYNIPLALETRGQLDVAALNATLSEVVRRHEVLRTRFDWILGELVQVIEPPEALPVPAVDLSALPAAIHRAEGRRLIAQEALFPFDLATGPLVRATLVQLTDDHHLILLTMHHIVSDGWSMGLLIKELMALYEACLAGSQAHSPLPELAIQYADFALWQRRMLEGPMLERQLGYWRQQLKGVPEIDLPTDRPRPSVPTWRGANLRRELPEQLTRDFQAYARNEDVTLYMALLASFLMLLSRATGQRDVSIGSPIANRDRLEIEGLMGFFVNTLVLRTDLSGDPTFRELLNRVREVTLNAYAHQEVPFEKLVEELQPDRDLSKTPYSQVMFSLQNMPMGRLELPGLALDLIPLERELANFELSVTFFEGETRLISALGYNRDLFDPTTVERLWVHFAALLESLVSFPELRLSEHSTLSAGERHQVLIEWNDTTSAYPHDLTIAGAFGRQVERTPEGLAVEFGDERLTYRRLARRAVRLADRLRGAGVATEEPVGLCAEPGADMVVGLLGIVAAGGTYLPLDPGYPPERIRFMVEDAGAAVILTQEHLRERLPEALGSRPIERLMLADEARDDAAEEDCPGRELADLDLDPASLAYVTYTSGSTGRPKGIGIPHHAVLRLVLDADFVQLGPGHRVAQASNVSFDAATFEIWGALLTGATLVGVPRGVALSPEAFATALRDRRVTTLFLTTALFNQMAREAPGGFDSLDHLLFGGEAVDPVWVHKVSEETAPGRRLLHVYGPTESTTFSTWQRVAKVPSDARTVPIGQPVAASTAYVVDRGLRPVSVASLGELVLGGSGLARGYAGRPALTARRFVPDPLSRRSGSRVYRSGDLVRRRVSGEIEFVGRFDHQVKLRGFRIELGEIEAVLAQHAEVSESVVVLSTVGESGGRLVAYVVRAGDERPEESQLRAFLKERLPEYMVPAIIVHMESLPLSPHGKVDRSALPEPDDVNRGLEGAYVAPRNPAEGKLAEIVAGLLGIEQVGVNDDFFELGGHSLLATQLLAQIRREFGVKLLLRDLFEGPTVAQLADRVGGTQQNLEAPLIEPAPRDGMLPLSYAQHRLWFIDQLAPESSAYNIPVALRMEGELEVPALERTIDEIVRRHEVLRTCFGSQAGQPTQVIEPARPQPLPMVDLAELAAEDRESEQRHLVNKESVRIFDLTRLPLARLTLIRLERDLHTLVVCMHHIISDGWSMEVLVREVGSLYGAFSTGQPSPLRELPIQYADFSIWQRQWLADDTLDRLLAYWKQHLGGELPAMALPVDRPPPAIRSFRGYIESIEMPLALSHALRDLSNQHGVTLYMTLLAAFQAFLSRLTDQEDVIVGTAVAGRTRPETEGLIGFFVNMLPIRADLSGDPGFLDLLQQTKETALSAFAHQDIPLERLIEELRPERQGSDMPLFPVAFGVRGSVRDDLELPGLRLRPLSLDFDTVRLDLSLWVSDMHEALVGTWHYSSDIFDRSTVVRMHERFVAFLQGIVDQPEAWISTFEIRSRQEQEAQLEEQARKQASKLQKLRGVRRRATSIPRGEKK